jgi:hypothetical protein
MNSRQENFINPQAELSPLPSALDRDLRQAQSWHSTQDVAKSNLNIEIMVMQYEIQTVRAAYDHDIGYLKEQFKELEVRKEQLEFASSQPKAYLDIKKAYIKALEESVSAIEADVKADIESMEIAEVKYAKWEFERGHKIRKLVFNANNKFAAQANLGYTRVLSTNSASSSASTPFAVISSSLSSVLGVVKSAVSSLLADPEVQKTLVEGIAGSLLAGSVSSLGMFAQNTSTPAQLAAPQNYTNNTSLKF